MTCPSGYRAGVGIMLYNRAKKIFVAQRLDKISEAWQMPQGGIDANETPRQALWRELMEEVGTNKAVLIAESARWLTYDLPATLQPHIWGGRFKGACQKWFLLRFDGTDSDINIDGVGASKEFSAWRWVDRQELVTLIVPFKRSLYETVVAEFTPALV